MSAPALAFTSVLQEQALCPGCSHEITEPAATEEKGIVQHSKPSEGFSTNSITSVVGFSIGEAECSSAAQLRADDPHLLKIVPTKTLRSTSMVRGTMHNLEILSFGARKFHGRGSLATMHA